MKKISYCFLFLLSVYVYSQEKESLPVVSEVKDLKNIQAKKIIWQKDKSIMVAIPSSDTIKPFWMDTMPTITELVVKINGMIRQHQ